MLSDTIGRPSLDSIALGMFIRVRLWGQYSVNHHIRLHLFGDLVRKRRNGDWLTIGSGSAGHDLSRVRRMVLDLRSPVSILENLEFIY